MGKLADALDHYKENQSLRSADLKLKARDKLPDSPQRALARQLEPLHQWHPKLVVLSDPNSSDAENFKLLRAQILYPRNETRPRVIMVTSPFPEEGKTFIAANLAVSLALGIDEHVLLIDGDLRRPKLHELFGYAAPEGLHEYLTGKKSIPELMVRTRVGKLALLPAGSIPSNPAELLSSMAMGELLKEIRNRYDDRYIVIDSTPCHVTAEAKALAKHVDGIVLVVMARKTPHPAIEKAIENLGREKILGIVFNGHCNGRNAFNHYYRKYP